MSIKKLKGHEYANAKVVFTEDGVLKLYSYDTEIISVDSDGLGNREIKCTGLYSMTTRKHISWFLREYLPDITYNQVRDMDKNVPVLM